MTQHRHQLQPCIRPLGAQDIGLEPRFGDVAQLVWHTAKIADEEPLHSFQIKTVQCDMFYSHFKNNNSKKRIILCHKKETSFVRREKSIVLFDNYVDDTVLTLLDKRKLKVTATIYIQNVKHQLSLDIAKHNTIPTDICEAVRPCPRPRPLHRQHRLPYRCLNEGPWQTLVLIQQDGDDSKRTAVKCEIMGCK